MYFKRLEIFGFKSFADKTRLDFEPGITAVVGPNGCGKSNIADAIKWVLGEQSAKMMRGSKMEDVIFNGTDSKEPVNYAEVALTLSNQDRTLAIEYDEVTVARRLYRSGESEYLLNKTPVRLKDVSELFMGTGIGTSAYSLIEQGKIDQILSSRPEDRREVFEEASGITKYKAKRKEALRRLDDTEQNLTRINDIILEVKRQINSIERQARKAERYKERYEELKELELKLSRIELEILKQKLSHCNKNIDEQKKEENQLNTELQKATGELSELNEKRSQVETKRMDYKSNIIQMDSNVSKSKDKITLNKERVEELKKRRVDLESEIKNNEESVKSQRKEVDALREKVSVLENEGKEKSEILAEKDKRLGDISKSIEGHETIVSTSKANVMDLASKESQLRNQQAKASASLASHEARLKRLETELGTITEEKNILDAKFNDATKEVEVLGVEISSLSSERDKSQQDIFGLTSRIETLEEELKEIYRSLAADKSKIEVLEEAKAKYEGFSSGVRSILGKSEDVRHEIEGIRDVLANLFSVKKGYEVSIETALGENLQSIVVDTMEAAEKAIAFLRENSRGRASFIHPGSFTKTAHAVGFKNEKILGKAADFIEVKDDSRCMIDTLLNDIFIVKSTEDALEILKENKDIKKETFITIDGAIVRNGFISGGDISNEGLTLINREAKIKELSEEIARLESGSQSKENEKKEDTSKKTELEKKLEEATKNLNQKEILFANSKSRKINIEENINSVKDELSLISLETDEARTEIERLKEEDQFTATSLSKVVEDTKLNAEKIRNSESLINEQAKEKETLLIETAEQRTDVGSLESKKDGLLNTLNILETSFKDAENISISRKTELESSIKKVEELSQEVLNLEQGIETLSTDRLGKDKELEDIEKSYSDIMGMIKQSNAIFKESEIKINELRSVLHKVDLEKAETNYSVENLTQRIRDVYKIDLAEIQVAENWQDVEKEQLKKEVDEKREKVDSMGTVNLVAIEEHTELQDRYNFLIHQRDDLLKAKDSLLKAIAKINKTTKELFLETFNNIQVEFRNFFKMLFGGGDGELILLDEGNILESGIEIVARPPGKRLQNVSLLSGGEKALTAISLIFAIFKVRPSPFCVLDEIDAPLDESNVGRFSRSLDLFTKTSQFIVITHNKKTIDMADVMYGITMQESGISKVVSVKFSDAKKQAAAATS